MTMPDPALVEALRIEVGDGPDRTSIALRRRGAGPPLVLLHGFPETQLMWEAVATRLAANHTVITLDLRGYGASGCPASAPDHAPYAKRAMAKDVLAVMQRLGHERFALVGHDRGGRVAYRLALDHPDRVERLAVLDVLPTLVAWEQADHRFALAYWPWTMLAQPAPLPERMLVRCAREVVDAALDGWGSPGHAFPEAVRTAYAAASGDEAHAHAICEEYRAAATIDRQHDAQDEADGRRIRAPVLVLWGRGGALDAWYAAEGGPLGIWRRWADDVTGGPIEGGHFFPEASPSATVEALERFLARP